MKATGGAIDRLERADYLVYQVSRQLQTLLVQARGLEVPTLDDSLARAARANLREALFKLENIEKDYPE